jgi:hypothetical protein
MKLTTLLHVRFENEHSPCFSHGDDVEEEI